MHSRFLMLLLFLLLPARLLSAPPSGGVNGLPEEDTHWPSYVFARPDSFSVRYGEFYDAHFGGTKTGDVPDWLELDHASLPSGERMLAKPAVVRDNEEEILGRLRTLVSMKDEIGLTQFGLRPVFPPASFILGRQEGSLTLVSYDAMGVQDTLRDLEAVRFLRDRDAFLTAREDSRDLIVVSRGSLEEVDIWYPRMAREVLHTHTIPGNINPTGYFEFFEGSDRDLILSTYKFQEPVRRFLISRRQ